MILKPAREIQIAKHKIGLDRPVYFIADVAANHDGNLERAKELIYLAAESGADAAKFQHFTANTIVSDYGFKSLGSQKSHQSTWKKSVYEIYENASLNRDWTQTLADTCKKAGITFFTSPYSYELVDYVDQFVPAYKIGSGDITWLEIIRYMANKNKPMLIASGASTLDEVVSAVNATLEINPDVVLMQCNTNYTASLENFKYIQLNVLKTYASMFPDLILGLSDHTPGHSTVLGAVALGARVIEKHFTDSVDREGPDHKFSMDPASWREMVDRTRELEASLGGGIKQVEENEKETVILQRRAIRASRDISIGEQFSLNNLEVLRPCPSEALTPNRMNEILQKTANSNIRKGEHIKWSHVN